ncbi:hypothetical protein TB2_033076 [Malus domestica]
MGPYLSAIKCCHESSMKTCGPFVSLVTEYTVDSKETERTEARAHGHMQKPALTFALIKVMPIGCPPTPPIPPCPALPINDSPCGPQTSHGDAPHQPIIPSGSKGPRFPPA